MITNKKITNSLSDISGFSRVTNLSRSDNEGGCVKVLENKLWNFKSNNNLHGIGSLSSSNASQNGKIIKKSNNSNCISTYRIGELRENSKKLILSNKTNDKQSTREGSSALSFSSEGNSTGSFLSSNSQGESRRFINARDDLTQFSEPMRLFNKSGKPLTDRMGRPLLNIFGEQLVIFDDKGKVISDFKGNQVFNSLGESTIYPSTNLYIPPSEEEPGIPLLDINKEHILFLFDNKGHPLTDSFGRPLLCASGNPMLGLNLKAKVNINCYEHYKLKNMYSRKPLENFVRHVQIFDSDGKPLTDDCGRLLEGAKLICNKNGMPMCDSKGRPIYFRSGNRILMSRTANKQITEVKGHRTSELDLLQSSTNSLGYQNFQSGKCRCESDEESEELNTKNIIASERCNSDGIIKYSVNDSNLEPNVNLGGTCETKSLPVLLTTGNENKSVLCCQEVNEQDALRENENIDISNEKISIDLKDDNISFPSESVMSKEGVKEQINIAHPPKVLPNVPENKANGELSCKEKCNKESMETIFLFNATEKMENKKSSSDNVAHFEAIKGRQLKLKRKLPKKMYSLNFFQFFRDAFSKSSERQGIEQYQFNEYGKPLKDIHGNLLYDKYGIPLTGAQGRRLSEAARHALRLKLTNVPKTRANIAVEETFPPLPRNESHDQFGEPVYDKYGRPLYDLAGRLIYDRFGRPLTDAFGRALVDAIGQPLMDCEGKVLTSVYESDSNIKLVDIFGRKIYDKHGRPLFDSYGRPKFDIFTNAIYDNCGRPATDANGKILFDFLNKPIQPYPEKPLYKNAKARLPKYIDTILAVPSMYRVLKYSQPLEDVFGGPLFDDLGRPLYNNIGKPLFDRYGRPLYSKNGTPLCDCFGRPLSEDVRQSEDDQTLSVVDCLKLLKVTEESSKWMLTKNKVLKSNKPNEVHKNAVISYKKKSNKKCGQYVYSLTRVTRFASGHQALEILEAPLSPATVAEMHRLPVDNKPLVMVVGQRHNHTVKQR